MSNKYINTDTFEIIENPNFFEVDELIAETISILNKKGYKTSYSCSGHNDKKCYRVIADIDFLEEVKKQGYDIGKIYNDYFEYYSDEETTNIYIKFAKHYDFENIPKDFEYETVDEQIKRIEELSMHYSEVREDKDISYGDVVTKIIKLFDDGIRIGDDVIEAEIKTANEILLKWAKSLPINK